MAREQPGRRRIDLMKRGEIWLVGLDPTQGHEQKGRRAVLIVSPEAFNRLTKVPVVLPIASGGNFARTAGFAVALAGAGTKTKGVIGCDQPRALDLGARNGKKLETVPDAVMEEVLARLASIFEGPQE
jgi:mRNA-degrading endonuclease toxin of MazEF toxin-antitoxin module